MKAERIVLSWGLPKTGQRIEYAAGDDGTHEAGWWQGLLNVNNKERFVAKTIDEGVVVIDKATGLMWVADAEDEELDEGEPETWDGAIYTCNSLEYAGFTDWRLPNIMELLSIIRYASVGLHYYYTYFSIPNWVFWTSNTDVRFSQYAYAISFVTCQLRQYLKTSDTIHILPVRGGL